MRQINVEQTTERGSETYLTGLRDVQMPALGRALELLPAIDFPRKQTLLPELQKLHKLLLAQQDLRARLAKALLAGEKAEMTSAQWSPVTTGQTGSAVVVAEAALEAAKDHIAGQRSLALRSLVTQSTLLVVAIGLSLAAMLAISRRVITPLRAIRDAMLRVASGDLDVETGTRKPPRRDRRANGRAGDVQAAGKGQTRYRGAGT